MLAAGLLASALGLLSRSEASRRLPTAVAGRLVVFETLAALACAMATRSAWPPLASFGGIALLVAGVIRALRGEPEPLLDGRAGAPH